MRSQKLHERKLKFFVQSENSLIKKDYSFKEKSNNTRSNCIIMWQAGICKHVRDFFPLIEESTSYNVQPCACIQAMLSNLINNEVKNIKCLPIEYEEVFFINFLLIAL